MSHRCASVKVGPNDDLAAPTGHQTTMSERKWPVIQHSEETMRKANQMAMKADIEIVDMEKYVSSWAKPSKAKWHRSAKKQYTVWDVLTACVVAVAFACAVFYSI